MYFQCRMARQSPAMLHGEGTREDSVLTRVWGDVERGSWGDDARSSRWVWGGGMGQRSSRNVLMLMLVLVLGDKRER